MISKNFFIRYSRWSYRNANVFVQFNRALCFVCVPSQVIDNNIVYCSGLSQRFVSCLKLKSGFNYSTYTSLYTF